eukprot:scaffold373695_cov31-Attheya_sp.AAC.1
MLDGLKISRIGGLQQLILQRLIDGVEDPKLLETKLVRGPGWTGATNATLLVTWRYSASVRVRARCPWMPPPRGDGMEAALPFSSSRA